MIQAEQSPVRPGVEGSYEPKEGLAFRLRAAAYHGEDIASLDAASHHALIAIVRDLRQGEAVAVQIGRSSIDGEVEWTIAGLAPDARFSDAKESSQRLYETISSALRSVPELNMALENDRLRRERRVWSLALSPAVALLSSNSGGQPIGFGGATSVVGPEGDVVALPLPMSPEPGGRSLLNLASRLPLDTWLRFTIRRYVLEERWRPTLERVLRSIQRGTLVGQRLDTGFRLGHESLGRLRGYWEPLLQSLLMDGCGCLVDVAALSPRFSAGVATQLGAAAWPGFDVAYQSESTKLPGNALDLRSLIPDEWIAARLAPSGGDLERLAFPPAFRAPLERPRADGIRLGSAGGFPVALGDSERGRHIYILGATGTGKTALIGNCVKHAISAGEGVALLDPHGDLVADVLRWLPPGRARDVILFDPSDSNRAPGLNLLDADIHRIRAGSSIIANEMVEVFRRLYKLTSSTGGPVFEQYVRNAILLLADNDVRPPLTLCEVPLVFESPRFRAALLRRCSNPHVVSFWRNQAERVTGEGALSNMGPWITSKMNQFTQNPLIRPIVGQSMATIDFRKCMDDGKILLCDLKKGNLGSYDVRLLGMLLTTKLLHAAMSRVDIRPDDRRPFSLFIDEVQNFVSDSVAQGLSEARKFGLRVVLANQHLAQLDRADPDARMATAILGNAANLLLFRLGPSDAAALEAYTRPTLTAVDLQFLPDYHAAARILRDGRPLRPFVLTTDPPIGPEHPESQYLSVMQSIASGRAEYTRPVDVIEREIGERRAAIELTLMT